MYLIIWSTSLYADLENPENMHEHLFEFDLK